MANIKIDDISSEIVRQLQLYTKEVEEELAKAQKEVARETAAELKQTSPKDNGDYSEGWRAKKVGNKYVVHNATRYQLTHLLENGHAKVSGGRVDGKPHIEPAEQKAIKEYVGRVERAIGK